MLVCARVGSQESTLRELIRERQIPVKLAHIIMGVSLPSCYLCVDQSTRVLLIMIDKQCNNRPFAGSHSRDTKPPYW